MNAQSVVTEVILIPRRYWERRNIGPYFLLKETGYFESHAQVSEESIAKALLTEPGAVQEWIQFCEDKRTDSGWYIKEDPAGGYVVAYLPSGRTGTGQDLHRTHYADAVSACSAYIKREIEDIRKE